MKTVIKAALTMLLPFYIVHAYRVVPGRVRGHYPGFPVSSSHMALDWMSQGMNGWTAMRSAISMSGHGLPRDYGPFGPGD